MTQDTLDYFASLATILSFPVSLISIALSLTTRGRVNKMAAVLNEQRLAASARAESHVHTHYWFVNSPAFPFQRLGQGQEPQYSPGSHQNAQDEAQ